MIDFKVSDKIEPVVAAPPVAIDDELVVAIKQGMVIRTPVADISQFGQSTQRVRVIRLNEEDAVVSVTRFTAGGVRTNTSSDRRLFILGAGFAREAGDIVGSFGDRSRIVASYPLVTELAQLCFPGRTFRVGNSIEEWFHQAIQDGDFEPLRRMLEDALMQADIYLPIRLVGGEAQPGNPFQQFFDVFADADFITFNYDSFVEQALFNLHRWQPRDGFGVAVDADLELGLVIDYSEFQQPSTSQVLHMHGTLAVYTVKHALSLPDETGTSWISDLPRPQYHFDPDRVGNAFFPWRKVRSPFGFGGLSERVIAPVPEKSFGLKKAFVAEVGERARALCTTASDVVAIGYNFSETDRASWAPLMHAIAESKSRRLLIVAPTAEYAAERIRALGLDLNVCAVPLQFSCWVEQGFPGVVRWL